MGKEEKDYKFTLGIKDEIPFGKYKGTLISEIIRMDIGYLTWAMNEHYILLTNEAYIIYNNHIR